MLANGKPDNNCFLTIGLKKQQTNKHWVWISLLQWDPESDDAYGISMWTMRKRFFMESSNEENKKFVNKS